MTCEDVGDTGPLTAVSDCLVDGSKLMCCSKNRPNPYSRRKP